MQIENTYLYKQEKINKVIDKIPGYDNWIGEYKVDKWVKVFFY